VPSVADKANTSLETRNPQSHLELLTDAAHSSVGKTRLPSKGVTLRGEEMNLTYVSGCGCDNRSVFDKFAVLAGFLSKTAERGTLEAVSRLKFSFPCFPRSEGARERKHVYISGAAGTRLGSSRTRKRMPSRGLVHVKERVFEVTPILSFTLFFV
jgi:hypothetical protein